MDGMWRRVMAGRLKLIFIEMSCNSIHARLRFYHQASAKLLVNHKTISVCVTITVIVNSSSTSSQNTNQRRSLYWLNRCQNALNASVSKQDSESHHWLAPHTRRVQSWQHVQSSWRLNDNDRRKTHFWVLSLKEICNVTGISLPYVLICVCSTVGHLCHI